MFRWQTSEHDLPGTSIFSKLAPHERSMFEALHLWWNGFVEWVPVKAKIQCLVKPIGQCHGHTFYREVAKVWIYVVFCPKTTNGCFHSVAFGIHQFEDWKLAEPLEVEVGQEWLDHRVVRHALISSTILLEFVVEIERRWYKLMICYMFFFADSGCITNMSWSVVRRRISWNGKLMV